MIDARYCVLGKRSFLYEAIAELTNIPAGALVAVSFDGFQTVAKDTRFMSTLIECTITTTSGGVDLVEHAPCTVEGIYSGSIYVGIGGPLEDFDDLYFDLRHGEVRFDLRFAKGATMFRTKLEELAP